MAALSMCLCSLTEDRRRPWTAAPVSFDSVTEGSSAASDVKSGGAQDYVYDLYVLQDHQGASNTSDWWSSPEVQVKHSYSLESPSNALP